MEASPCFPVYITAGGACLLNISCVSKGHCFPVHIMAEEAYHLNIHCAGKGHCFRVINNVLLKKIIGIFGPSNSVLNLSVCSQVGMHIPDPGIKGPNSDPIIRSVGSRYPLTQMWANGPESTAIKSEHHQTLTFLSLTTELTSGSSTADFTCGLSCVCKTQWGINEMTFLCAGISL